MESQPTTNQPAPSTEDVLREMLTEALQELHNQRSSQNRDNYWCFICFADTEIPLDQRKPRGEKYAYPLHESWGPFAYHDEACLFMRAKAMGIKLY